MKDETEIVQAFEQAGVSVFGIQNDYNDVWLVDVPEIHPDNLAYLSEEHGIGYSYIHPYTEKYLTVVVKY